jgi:hypothetical protein
LISSSSLVWANAFVMVCMMWRSVFKPWPILAAKPSKPI